jgi:hypothetical protein
MYAGVKFKYCVSLVHTQGSGAYKLEYRPQYEDIEVYCSELKAKQMRGKRAVHRQGKTRNGHWSPKQIDGGI